MECAKRLEARKELAREVADAERQQVREERDREAGRRAARGFWVDTLAEAEEQQCREMVVWQAVGTEAENEERAVAETKGNVMYSSLPLVALKVVARNRGLSAVGEKAILVQRLQENDLAAAAEHVSDTQPVTKSELDVTEMENYDTIAREAHWTAVYEANERGARDMNQASKAQQRVNEQEAMEAAQKVADELEAREEHCRRQRAARAMLSIRAEEEGYVVSEEQVKMEVAAMQVQEVGEAILVKARARNQVSSDAKIAQRMAEEFANEAEQEKA